jgi:hypothetical protein
MLVIGKGKPPSFLFPCYLIWRDRINIFYDSSFPLLVMPDPVTVTYLGIRESIGTGADNRKVASFGEDRLSAHGFLPHGLETVHGIQNLTGMELSSLIRFMFKQSLLGCLS